MDTKDLRTESALSLSISDGDTNFNQDSTALQSNIKLYQSIGSNSLGKVEAQVTRPCAVIGPDRVIPPPTATDVYLKKAAVEPWPCNDNIYQQSDIPLKLPEYQPSRNISPRQTFQENMPRIMVPPSHNTLKDNANLKNTKPDVALEVKYCDVPYSTNPVINVQQSIRNSELPISSANLSYGRNFPAYGWNGNVSTRPRPYAPEIYQYSDIPNYMGPRPMLRPHRTIQDDPAQANSDHIYQETNVRFKPYPTVKERCPQVRYNYVNNYHNTFPPTPFPPHNVKYDNVQKGIPPHPYSMYQQIPLRRMPEPNIDSYQRCNQQTNFNLYNQYIPPHYGPVPGSCIQNKVYNYPPELTGKSPLTNKLSYDINTKTYLEYENSRQRMYLPVDNVYCNDPTRPPNVKSDVTLPIHPGVNFHHIPHNQYRKEIFMKNFEGMPNYRGIDSTFHINNSLPRHPLQYSPSAIAMSPVDSNASNEAMQALGAIQEDCGYASQSSNASSRSIDSGNYRLQNDNYKRYDYMYTSSLKHYSQNLRSDINSTKKSDPDKKNLDVRQFLQMWNESEDEVPVNNTPVNSNNNALSETISNPEQLYVLGLVNIPNEELPKYEHIQKISKLPENIKGYNSVELLDQYEQLVESPTLRNNKKTIPHQQFSPKALLKQTVNLPRPLSPLDVESKISQSVIHKDVGCNFEIKPCSPKMLNVEVATPATNIFDERMIEKVINLGITSSPILPDQIHNHQDTIANSPKAPSCKMNSPYLSNNDLTKTNNYTLTDLESNSGICLASLPRLDSDIELNFPEINQQFIDANINNSVNKSGVSDGDELNYKYTLSLDNNTTDVKHISKLTKLSKYRKLKTIESTVKEIDPFVSVNRTDSVIIKNPENPKSQNELVSNKPIVSNNGAKTSFICENDKKEIISDLVNNKAIDYRLPKTRKSIDNSMENTNKNSMNNQACTFSLLIEEKTSTQEDSVILCSTKKHPVQEPTDTSLKHSQKFNSLTEKNINKSTTEYLHSIDTTTIDSSTNNFYNNTSSEIKKVSDKNITEINMNNEFIKSAKNDITNDKDHSNYKENMNKYIIKNKNGLNDESFIKINQNETESRPPIMKQINAMQNEISSSHKCESPEMNLIKFNDNNTNKIYDYSMTQAPFVEKNQSYTKDAIINTETKKFNGTDHVEDLNINGFGVTNDTKLKSIYKNNSELNNEAHSFNVVKNDETEHKHLKTDINTYVTKESNLQKPNKHIIEDFTNSAEFEFNRDNNIVNFTSNNEYELNKDNTIENLTNNDKCVSNKDTIDNFTHNDKLEANKDIIKNIINNYESDIKKDHVIESFSNNDRCESNKDIIESLTNNDKCHSNKDVIEGFTNNNKCESNKDIIESLTNNDKCQSNKDIIEGFTNNDKCESNKDIIESLTNNDKCQSNKDIIEGFTNNDKCESNKDIIESLTNNDKCQSNKDIIEGFTNNDKCESNKDIIESLSKDHKCQSNNDIIESFTNKNKCESNKDIIKSLIYNDKCQSNKDIIEGFTNNGKYPSNKDNIDGFTNIETCESNKDIIKSFTYNDQCESNKDIIESFPSNDKFESNEELIESFTNTETCKSNNVIIESFTNTETCKSNKVIIESLTNNDTYESNKHNIESSISNNKCESNEAIFESFTINDEYKSKHLFEIKNNFDIHKTNKNILVKNSEIQYNINKDKTKLETITSKADIYIEKITGADITLENDYKIVSIHKNLTQLDKIESKFSEVSFNTDAKNNITEKNVHAKYIHNSKNIDVSNKSKHKITNSPTKNILRQNTNDNSRENIKKMEIGAESSLSFKENILQFNTNENIEGDDETMKSNVNIANLRVDKLSVIKNSTNKFLQHEREHSVKFADLEKISLKDNLSELTNVSKDNRSKYLAKIGVERNNDVSSKAILFDTKNHESVDSVSLATLRSSINKELFSPWIQKLCMYYEGLYYGGKAKEQSIVKFDSKKVILKDDCPNSVQINYSATISKHEQEEFGHKSKINSNSLIGNLQCNINNTINNNAKQTIVDSRVSRPTLKRSLSDSAFELFNNNAIKEPNKIPAIKRRKIVLDEELLHSNVTEEDLSSLINRRNSMSAIYSEENFFILINDEYMIEEESDMSNICYAQVPIELCNVPDSCVGHVVYTSKNDCEEQEVEKEVAESLEDDVACLEDVACVETVFNDDVAEDITISARVSPSHDTDEVEDNVCNGDDREHIITRIKDIYGYSMCTNDVQLVETLYKTPQMDVNKTLVEIESQNYHEESKKNNTVGHDENHFNFSKLCEPLDENKTFEDVFHGSDESSKFVDDKENQIISSNNPEYKDMFPKYSINSTVHGSRDNDCIAHSLESLKSSVSIENDCNECVSSSSPEVSSTTSEEKASGIMLKISSYNGSKVAAISNKFTSQNTKVSYKLTEKTDYTSNCRPLITKAAQKYIPPLKISQGLKVKLPLPQHSLNKLKELKIIKDEAKCEKTRLNCSNFRHEIPKKLKPKFEDVLKSIDEMQFKKHKDKVKKTKHIPKVVIKKNKSGAHYASTPAGTSFNPDLTGRKWQPWVFIERNEFVDKMALKNKVKAIYCHRRQLYVLAERFKKYKSICTAKFVISQPNPNNFSAGNLKYTIKLKHNNY